MQPQETFQRYEKKYLLNATQYEKLLPLIEEHMLLDQYGKHLICNIYFDTDNFDLIRTSVEKPVYKEKFRLRSYGVPSDEDTVFLELKKKYDGIVYKRRVPMLLNEATEYLYHGNKPGNMGQIHKELDFTVQKYKLQPAVYLSYERMAYYGKEQADLRVTFDCNITARRELLDLQKGSFGTSLIKESEYLMELKIPESIPLWLSRALSENSIFPVSFSKYGTYYTRYIIPKMSFHTISGNSLCKKEMIHRRAVC